MDPTVDPDYYKHFQVVKKLGEEHFPWSVRILKISFLYPFQNKIVQKLGNLTLCSCLIFTLVGTILKFFKVNEIEDLVEITLQTMAFMMMTFCYMFMIGSKKKIHMSLVLMGKMWLTNSKDIQEMMMKYARKGYSLSHFQAVSILLLCIGIGIAPVAIPSFLTWALPGNQTYEKNLPLQTDFFFNKDEYFYHIFAAQVVFLFIYGLLIDAMNCIQCFAIIFLLAEIQCLQYTFEKVNDVYIHLMALNEKNANTWLCKKIKDLVGTHQICIDLYSIIRNTSNPLMFVILAGTSFIVVVTATAMVILVETDLAAAAKMLLTFCIALCSIIFICTPSQLLKIISEDFYIASCGISGHVYSPKIRKMLLFIMMGSMKPLVLNAGPTIELNFETYCQIIKTSLSYVATFRSVYMSL